MAGAVIKKRFTADEYQRMGQVGILSNDDRVELIDGEAVAMRPIGARHNACVNHATRALVRAAGDDAIVQAQGSVQLDLYHEPAPDLVLLRPQLLPACAIAVDVLLTGVTRTATEGHSRARQLDSFDNIFRAQGS